MPTSIGRAFKIYLVKVMVPRLHKSKSQLDSGIKFVRVFLISSPSPGAGWDFSVTKTLKLRGTLCRIINWHKNNSGKAHFFDKCQNQILINVAQAFPAV